MSIKKMISELFDIKLPEAVSEVDSDGVYVSCNEKGAVVGGATIPQKARAYSLLAKNIREGKSTFEISEKPHFETLGAMIDMSRGGVMKVESVKKYIKYLAAHGYNMLMLYTEDTYEVKEYPYLGYQRGRYTVEELREIDDFAFALGIEVIPCIQTLGHMEQFLRYSVNDPIADNARVLLVGEEKTYEFIEACIKTVRSAFRTKRIHIGCDETVGLGLGQYLVKNGMRDRFEIFSEHLGRVCELCRKYDFHPMMWSDMYFSIVEKSKEEDYMPHVIVPQYAIDAMPDADMVFWDYYHTNNEFYKINIEKHKNFNRPVVFGGGIWTWDGFVPNYDHTYNTMKPALEECLRGGVPEVVVTIWSNDGCETSHMLAIPSLSLFSEYCYKGETCTEDDIWSFSNFATGMTEELSHAISDFFFREDGAIRAGKHVLWSDPLINLLCFDINIEGGKKYLTDAIEVCKKYENTGYILAVLRACLDKCDIHLNLRNKYKAGDRAWLSDFVKRRLPEIIADFEKLHTLHREMWYRDYKVYGFENIMCRYGAAIERLRHTERVINDYLSGVISEIEELEPELIRGQKCKWLGANDFMYIHTM